MKELFKILFEDKKPEDQPLKLEIKLKSTATPDEELDQNEWYQYINQLIESNGKRS
jgi:polyisoprenoid-binding protein YceI